MEGCASGCRRRCSTRRPPEIPEAFELSGVDSEQVLGLFRRGLAAECAARPVYSGQAAPGVLSEALQTRADQWRELSPQLRKMLKKTRAIHARHRATAKEYGPKHEKMIAVEREKRAQVAELKRMVPARQKQVAASVRAYVKAAQEGERPTNERMTAFRKAVLSPLFAWRAAPGMCRCGLEATGVGRSGVGAVLQDRDRQRFPGASRGIRNS